MVSALGDMGTWLQRWRQSSRDTPPVTTDMGYGEPAERTSLGNLLPWSERLLTILILEEDEDFCQEFGRKARDGRYRGVSPGAQIQDLRVRILNDLFEREDRCVDAGLSVLARNFRRHQHLLATQSVRHAWYLQPVSLRLLAPQRQLVQYCTHTTNPAGQVSGRFSADPANSFLLIYGDFGELSEKFHLGALAGRATTVLFTNSMRRIETQIYKP